MKNNHVTILQIDLNAVSFNLNYFKSKLQKNTKVLAVVKAFGYGSDAIEIAKHIQSGVSYFAVAYSDEGIALRDAGIHTPILVLHPQISNLQLIIDRCLEPNLYNFSILNRFIELTEAQKLNDYPIHIKFNTGLNRLGFKPNEVNSIAEKVNATNSVKITSIFSHLAASEDKKEYDFSLNQISLFKNLSSEFERKLDYKPMLHMCNTSGVVNFPEAHFDMVRLGIGLYGFGNENSVTNDLKNVITLKSVISQIHTINKGESVGYNRSFIADTKIKTATIPIGHADGISRKLGNGIGFVTINNQKASIVGNVCMDMIMVDITTIDCNAGDEVVIFDNQQTIEELSKNYDTIPYELITAISQRIKRQIKC
ncbi:MAG: alanine racemase [Urechidicola sp.]|jgi:alanine racemase|tara:strand:+ start:261 stop:1364 length:1104 start_codon:yes stop_codon:yes gene_type:complete